MRSSSPRESRAPFLSTAKRYEDDCGTSKERMEDNSFQLFRTVDNEPLLIIKLLLTVLTRKYDHFAHLYVSSKFFQIIELLFARRTAQVRIYVMLQFLN